jgi:hypothetical protein
MVAGMVTSNEMTICRPTVHRIFFGFSAAPTPRMEEITTWVEETGAPAMVERARAVPDESCESRE